MDKSVGDYGAYTADHSNVCVRACVRACARMKINYLSTGTM